MLENEMVKRWLKSLKPENTHQRRAENMIHGAPDCCLENTMSKIVQLGLNAEMLPVSDAAQHFLNIIKNAPQEKPYRKHMVFNTPDLGLLSNMLILGGFKDNKLYTFMLDGLDELYLFASKGNCNIYLSPKERAKLKGVPPNHNDIKHFTRPELFDEYGLCWPLIYDVIGLTKLYGTYCTETDRKIDAVINFISNDDFHNTIIDGYGILMTTGKTKYYAHGWDPKYPGWFNVNNYIENACDRNSSSTRQTWYVPKLLFFAMHIVHYPAALKTKWFSDLLECLAEYKTVNNTYEFPKEWLPEKTGYAVLGCHMSFGEKRRNRNWLEIESTFYMQLLMQNI